MTGVLSLPDAERLAERTRAAIPVATSLVDKMPHYAADRERVASDLGGLRDCLSPATGRPRAGYDRDARRYSDGLRRTAALYGVTP